MKRILKWSGRWQISQLIYILISILSGFFFFIWGLIHPSIPRCCQTFPLAKMSFSSKPKNVIPKGTLRELKLVQTINHRGSDTLKTEEVKTPRHGQQTTPSTSKQDHSSSPFKCPKLQDFNVDPITFDMEGIDVSKKRQTLVFLFQPLQKLLSDCLRAKKTIWSSF